MLLNISEADVEEEGEGFIKDDISEANDGEGFIEDDISEANKIQTAVTFNYN